LAAPHNLKIVNRKSKILFISLALILSACAPVMAAAPSATAIPAATAQATFTLPASATLPARATVQDTDMPQATIPAPTFEALLATLQPNPSQAAQPTDQRLPPEKWQEWPVVPAATARSRQIYQQGLAMGNDPHAFSKVGDCQSVTASFFGVYDQPGVYELPNGYERLQETIDWFKGSFGRESQAVRGGFNVASVLSSIWADPKSCQSGEDPLECEFRLHKPSIVLVSMETGFSGRTAAVYEKYMRQILDFVIAHGAAPILATKADNFEGDQSINLVTARLAAEYDLPLWNFWRAVQPLPDHGMDMVRNDKFHISVEAWNVRSFTGLEALDSVWRGVQ
jgi:hypothetical protein